MHYPTPNIDLGDGCSSIYGGHEFSILHTIVVVVLTMPLTWKNVLSVKIHFITKFLLSSIFSHIHTLNVCYS